MCGIFAYLNYLVEKDRKFILDTLCGGLQRLEYRGYDSAGEYQGVDSVVVSRRGNIMALLNETSNGIKSFMSTCACLMQSSWATTCPGHGMIQSSCE